MATMTATAITTQVTETYKLELMSAYGPVYRDVLKKAPRDCDSSEVPTIDLAHINGTEDQRRALAKSFRDAAENTGFFYIKNHGVTREKTEAALTQAKAFFAQPTETKEVVSQKKSKFFNGWTAKRMGQISPTETPDHREGFSFRYDPKYDPDTKDLDAVPDAVKKWLRCEDAVWDGTSHLPGFKEGLLAYWQSCLTLARSMIRIFALALDMPENYFDDVVTYPGR